MTNHEPMNYPFNNLLHIIFLIFLSSCASNAEEIKQRQKQYERSAQVHDRVAQDWRNNGNKDMALYHDEKAYNARHNKFAESCDFIDEIIFDVILDLDSCEHK